MRSNTLLIIAVIVAVLSLIFVPLIFIAALNTLFPVLAIGYTFYTWVSALFLVMVFGNQQISFSKKD
jgi:hypothetical protein